MLTVFAKSLDGGRMAASHLLGLALAAFLLAFAISQFRQYYRRVRLPASELPAEDDRERLYLSRQAWRRLQIAVLVGIAGFCMLLGMTIPFGDHPRFFALSWFGAILFGTWVVVLAGVDWIATWLYFGEARQINRAERLALRYKMDKFQEESLRMRDEAQKEAEAESGEGAPDENLQK